MNVTTDYIITGGQDGKRRLNILSDVLHDYTKTLLEVHGVTSGISFLDLGCGGGNVAEMVAGMVGNNGKITAVDFDDEIISLAQQDVMAGGVRNISFRAVSAYDIGYENEFDVSYARFLLSHLSKPLDVLLKMKQSVKPDGKVIIEDVDFSGHFCYPASKAFDRYLSYYTMAAKHNGADANIGPSLFSLFQQAGFSGIGFDVIQPVFNSGAGKRMAYVTMEKIQDTLIKHGMATGDTIKKILDELEAFTNDEQTIISLPRIFRVWGMRK